MDNQLARIDEQKKILDSFNDASFKTMLAIAEKLHKGGAFIGSITSPEQAFTVIQAGYEMGIAPVESLNSFYIVKGKITIYGVATAKRVKMHGWKIKIGKHDKEICELTVFKGDESYEYTAKKEQVVNLGGGVGKNAYTKAPEDKLYWHAMSRIVRRYIPEVLGSVSYIHEEIEDGGKLWRPDAVEVLSEEEEKDIYDEAEGIINNLLGYKDYENIKEQIQKQIEKLSTDKQSLLIAMIAEKLEELKPEKRKETIDKETGEVIGEPEDVKVNKKTQKKMDKVAETLEDPEQASIK